MRFLLGFLVALLVLAAICAIVLNFGFFPTAADVNPPIFERRMATSALDSSIERHAARVNNPLPATDENLIDGMKIYTMNCSLCHGTLDNKPSPLEKSFYPPPPQLVLDPLDDPEWHIYYAVSTGVRYTGMPAWRHVLSQEDMWKVVGFLSRVQKLSPKVQEYWKNAYGVGPLPPGEEKHEHGKD